ncbi:MAG TPA: response regulator [Phenylobacterium sp.]|jgi:CheY-like chemotaxis protein|uniref:response regulator n=1 Tax=Phenylobacterium sp. TaxID=1871053 RepID=UPI002BD77104|nr:response regulator [Phenylobacterium sp.]HXA39599.1 response regulator [Phenylobacterium sp.]
MRPEFLHDRVSDAFSSPSTALANPKAAPAAAGGARDLYDLLAVVIGVCESLAKNLKASPQHAELARVGMLAADRAAGLLAGLRLDSGSAGDGPATSQALPVDDMPPQGQERARRVLLVEDDPDLLLLLTAAFVREGFQTYCARNGRVGVELLQALQPDLMVTDIVMPEMEGIGTIMEARRVAPDTRVIAISGGGHYGRSQNFLVWAQELGADEVLAKPFRMSSLITAARVVLDRPPSGPPGYEAEAAHGPGIAIAP